MFIPFAIFKGVAKIGGFHKACNPLCHGIEINNLL